MDVHILTCGVYEQYVAIAALVLSFGQRVVINPVQPKHREEFVGEVFIPTIRRESSYTTAHSRCNDDSYIGACSDHLMRSVLPSRLKPTFFGMSRLFLSVLALQLKSGVNTVNTAGRNGSGNTKICSLLYNN